MAEMKRRDFLFSTAGVAAALAADAGSKAANTLIPYVNPPENIKPGTWIFYTTTCRECPAGCGMTVWHRDGRVTKAEGNPNHPIGRGGLCARGQSSLQGLYDPDRLKSVLRRTPGAAAVPSDWATAISDISGKLQAAGGRAVVLSGLETGALAEVMDRFAAAFGSKTALYYEAFNYETLRAAHGTIFGQPVVPYYKLEECQFILSLGTDFLETWVSPVQFAYEFSQMHSYKDGGMGRFAYVGPRLSMTAASADYHLKVAPGGERRIAFAILRSMAGHGWSKGGADMKAALDAAGPAGADLPAGINQAQIDELARLFATSKASVALGGASGAYATGSEENALAAALLTYAAGRVGDTVDFSRPHALSKTATARETHAILADLGPKDVLIVCGTNPAFTMPGAAELIRQAGTVVYLGAMDDETAQLAHWALPVDYPLEAWGDYEPYVGVHELIQPTMTRLYDTRSTGDVLIALAKATGKPLRRGEPAREYVDFQSWVIARWQDLASRVAPGRGFDDFWTESLKAGGAWEEVKSVAPKVSLGNLRFSPQEAPPKDTRSAHLWLWPSVTLFDGRFANRGWMQEVPDPTTFNVWSTWVDVHPSKARALGLNDNDVVSVTTPGGHIEAAVHVTEDVADTVIAVPFGQGHTGLGRNARGVGANAFTLLAAGPEEGSPRFATLARTTGSHAWVSASATEDQHERKLMQWIELPFLKTLKWGQGDKIILPLPEGYDPRFNIYGKRGYKAHRWAMVVDMHRCIGCGACTAACYAENNVAVVGKEQVLRGRHMSWLRVVPYREEGNPARLGWIPLLCQHCDSAPCEPVCPVYASVHNEEGLNAQIYNRCIGTRYCSHNCPYKVRRFNWYNFDENNFPKPLDWQLNPEVTVRSRGVMEKCTYCVQRIRNAEYRAARENREVREGEITPACAQSCPAKVFTFGDLLDERSMVSDLTRNDPRRYHVLEELNTKPAVTYLRRIKMEGA
jgi:anaerobic selenocysteine-containing dehydrogenase/Fe-S-cluster-containing dehydrogenase component